MNGWFAMNRAMFKHPIFDGKPERVAAWAWMLASAAWKDTKQDASGKTVFVKRGQLLTSFRQMSKATGVSVQTLRTLIDRLKSEHAISTQTNTGRLLITICNYEKYQSGGEATNTPSTQQQHSSNTQNEQGNNIQPSSDEEDALSAPSCETVEVSILSKAVWDMGKPFLSSRGVKNPGAIIGRWLKGNTPPEIMTAMEMAQKSGTQDPIPYITQILSNGDFKAINGGRHDRTQFDAAHREYARRVGAGEIDFGPDPSDPFGSG